MSQRRRTPYKPPRDRRELVMAVLCALAVVTVTFVLIWVFRPNKDLGAPSKPLFTGPGAAPSLPESTPPAS